MSVKELHGRRAMKTVTAGRSTRVAAVALATGCALLLLHGCADYVAAFKDPRSGGVVQCVAEDEQDVKAYRDCKRAMQQRGYEKVFEEEPQ
jgi:hypothetical protein